MRRRDLLIRLFAFATSMLVHLMLLIALPLAIDAATPKDDPDNDSSDHHPMSLPVEVRLGIDESPVLSETWLGDIEPEPHVAEHHIVDQAAFAETESAATSPSPVVEVMTPASTEPFEQQAVQEPEPDAVVDAEAVVAFEPLPSMAVLAESVQQLLEVMQQMISAAATDPQSAPPVQDDQREQLLEQHNEQVEKEAQAPAADSLAEVGTPSDRQSPASSVIDVPREQWHLGRPLASQGLTIKPRRPQFELLTMLTAAPGNPHCQINFNREGVPELAVILRSSGDPRVDEAVLASLYRWRAEGAALTSLSDRETVDVQIRILLTRRRTE